MMSHSMYIGCRRDGEMGKRRSHEKILMGAQNVGER